MCPTPSFHVLQKIARAILFEIQISTLIYIRIKHQHAATSIVVAISCHCYALIHATASAAIAAFAAKIVRNPCSKSISVSS